MLEDFSYLSITQNNGFIKKIYTFLVHLYVYGSGGRMGTLELKTRPCMKKKSTINPSTKQQLIRIFLHPKFGFHL